MERAILVDLPTSITSKMYPTRVLFYGGENARKKNWGRIGASPDAPAGATARRVLAQKTRQQARPHSAYSRECPLMTRFAS
jgi:hypothetical protein